MISANFFDHRDDVQLQAIHPQQHMAVFGSDAMEDQLEVTPGVAKILGTQLAGLDSWVQTSGDRRHSGFAKLTSNMLEKCRSERWYFGTLISLQCHLSRPSWEVK